MENIKEMLKVKNETVLTEMFYQVYDEYFAGHHLYSFNPHNYDIYMFRSEKPKTSNTYYKKTNIAGCGVVIFNKKLTMDEIKKFMVHILASEITDTTRRNDRQKMEEIARVASEMGTTKEDIMSVYKISLK